MKKKYFIKEIESKLEREQYFNLSEKIGNLFSSKKWLNIHYDYVILIGIFDPNRRLIGGFNIVKKKKFLINAIRKPLFSPYNGLFFINPGGGKVSENTFNKKIFDLIANFLESTRLCSVSFQLEPHFSDMQSFIWKGFEVTPRYTYQIDLSVSESEILNNLHKTKRSKITGALNKGIKCIKSFDKELIKKLAYIQYSRKNILKNYDIVDRIIFDFALESNSFAFISFIENNPVAFSLCIHDDKTAYFAMGSYNDQRKDITAGTLCVYKSILYAKSIGLKKFDFEGSMLKGVELFFREFGGDLIPYFEVSKEPFIIKLTRIISETIRS